MNDRVRPAHNAAARLAALLAEYAVPTNIQTQDARGFNGLEDLEAWRNHSIGCDLIRTVDYTLQGMDAAGEEVEMFLLALPRWYAGVNFASTPWGTAVGAPREACSQGDIDLLRALGQIIKRGDQIELTEDDRRSLVDVLREARSLIEEDADRFSADVYQYLHGLVIRAEMVVDNLDRYGTEAVREVALELSGAMRLEAERADAEGNTSKGGRWRSAAAMLAGSFLGSASGHLGTQAITTAEQVAKQIAGG